MRTNRLALLAVPVIIAGTAGVAFTANAASAAPGVTAVTHVTNAADSGNNGNWAYDNYTRTLRITLDSSQPTGTPSGDLAYTATVTDRGTSSAIVGAYTPNQVVPGTKIAHSVSASMNGGASYAIVAPQTDALTGHVPGALNLHFGTATGDQTTSDWPEQAFASPSGVVSVAYTHGGNGWSWTYKTACEAWTDSGTNGDGNLAHDGNITGKICAVPRLYDGAAVYVSAVRENVTFKQTIGSWDEFKIVGPGPINGHIGWVQAAGHGVTNAAVYGGLNANSGYTVFYTPETHLYGKQIPGTKTGYVYFKS